MQTVKEQIQKNQFNKITLLYGTESYMIRYYRNQLKKGILGSQQDDMNFSYFEGEDISVSEILSMAQTLPFFSTQRLIMIENSKLFKVQNELSDALNELPDTTYLVFVEKDVDKRSKLYKMVSKLGTVAEIANLTEKELLQWIVAYCKRSGKRISVDVAKYLITKSGTDLEHLSNELEKVISFAFEKDIIDEFDIDMVGITQISGKIFEMLDCVAIKDQKRALQLYGDLLSVRERPSHILYLLTRHFNLLLQVKELKNSRVSDAEIAKAIGVPSFTIGKYDRQASHFSRQDLLSMVTACVDYEEGIKTGRMNEQIAVEMFITTHASKN